MMNLAQSDAAVLAYLRSPQAIRERCQQLFALALEDRLPHFRLDLTQLEAVANFVVEVTRQDYPDLEIPFHSRWRHFEVGGPARLAHLDRRLAEQSPLERARAKFDLVIPSVLLDAGAGDRWQYIEPGTGQTWARSEGLAVASFHLFDQGGFSSDPAQPLQTDAMGLAHLTETALAKGFQASPDNPLVGLEGRLSLLHKLAQALTLAPHLFGEVNPRPGLLVDYLLAQAKAGQLAATTVLAAVLEGLGDIWPGRMTIAGVNLGDVWPHPSLETAGFAASLIPFHKLSQWLTYSLLEPLQELGLTITGLEHLTGLPEYRNGGLCLDLGLLQVKDPALLTTRHRPGAAVIVEWRALTVCLLDAIATTMRQQLGQSEAALPLVKVLQGGTWAAGRRIAAQRRAGGIPPLQIESDGTVF